MGTFEIYPVGINEKVLVNLEMMCQCDCEKPGNPGYIENAPQCSNHGTYKCGICECAPDFFGRKCECDAENLSFSGDLEAGCRPDNTTSTLCNNRGDCICGKCKCNSEWDVEGYTACECRASNETCITPYGEHINKLCSGQGECVCGECKCAETQDGQYSGRYCEECPTCPGKCEELQPCVQC